MRAPGRLRWRCLRLCPAIILAVSLGIASLAKSLLLKSILGQHVRTLRMPLVYATAGAAVLGWGVTQVPEWLELVAGVPLILCIYGYFHLDAGLWSRGPKIVRCQIPSRRN